jgi:hypothetical protein
MKNIIVEGHRGYCAKYPENTLVSFEAALELGVDAIEFDVWLTTDKVPVLMHDGNAKRTCGVDAELRNMTLAEVKALEPAYRVKFGDEFADKGITVPTLEELLILCFMVLWAMIGNHTYSGAYPDYAREFNWFFTRNDPFGLFPSEFAPFVTLGAFFGMCAVIFALYFGIKALILNKKSKK